MRLLVPERSDARFTDWASRSYLREAHEAGIHVSFYEAGFLHSKLLVSDDNIATCGSTNIDFRSFENNFEANVFFYDEETACKMRDLFLADEQNATSFTELPGRMSPRFTVRLMESLTRLGETLDQYNSLHARCERAQTRYKEACRGSYG